MRQNEAASETISPPVEFLRVARRFYLSLGEHPLLFSMSLNKFVDGLCTGEAQNLQCQTVSNVGLGFRHVATAAVT